jgi:hypothetical protein
MKNKLIENVPSFIVILIWAGISGYVCIGGLSMIEATEKVKLIEKKVEVAIVREITLEGTDPASIINEITASTNNKNTQNQLTFEDKEAIQNLWHVYWYYRARGFSYIIFLTILPYTVLLFLSVGAAGVLGSIARIIIDHVRNIGTISESKYVAMPIAGFFMGIMVLAISYIIPTVIVKGDTYLNITSVVLICFFAGLFSDSFYKWIMNVIERFLTNEPSRLPKS